MANKKGRFGLMLIVQGILNDQHYVLEDLLGIGVIGHTQYRHKDLHVPNNVIPMPKSAI